MAPASAEEKAYEAKLAIVQAMNELCKTRPFSRVSVVDIAKNAGMSRSNFYYHFTDRNDAVRWLSCAAFARGIDQIGRTLSWYEGHLATTRVLVQFRALISAAAQDSGYTSAELFYLRHRKANLLETLQLRGVKPTDELIFQAEALAASEQHMTSSYIRGEFGDMTPQVFCALLAGVIPHPLCEAIDSEN